MHLMAVHDIILEDKLKLHVLGAKVCAWWACVHYVAQFKM